MDDNESQRRVAVFNLSVNMIDAVLGNPNLDPSDLNGLADRVYDQADQLVARSQLFNQPKTAPVNHLRLH